MVYTRQHIKTFSAIPGISLPQQARSQSLMDKVLQTLEEQLKVRPYTSITMAELALASNSSLASIYARFKSKDHLLLALAEKTFAEEIEPKYEAKNAPAWEKGLELEVFLEALFKILGKAYSEFNFILRPLFYLACETEDEDLKSFLAAKGLRNRNHFERVIGEVAKANGLRPSQQDLKFAVVFAFPALQHFFLFGQEARKFLGKDAQSFPKELAKATGRYLRGAR